MDLQESSKGQKDNELTSRFQEHTPHLPSTTYHLIAYDLTGHKYTFVNTSLYCTEFMETLSRCGGPNAVEIVSILLERTLMQVLK